MARRFPINVCLNVFGTVFSAAVGFATLPFLVKQLGSDNYGLWTLATATTGTFAALDLGIAASVGRLIAGKRPTDDMTGISRVVSSALAGLAILSVIAMILIFALVTLFPRLFHVPLSQRSDVTHALLILGFNVAVLLISSLFSTFLSSYERFDVDNGVDIIGLALRAALTFTLVRHGTTLTALALIITSCNLVTCVSYIVFALRIEPRLRLATNVVTIATAREILSFGLDYFAMVMLRVLVPQIATTTIGVFLGNSAVTTYAIARQLVSYSSTIVVAAANTATPRAAISHFAGRRDQQKSLFILGGRWAFAFSLLICGGLLCLGEPLLQLWQGGRHNNVYPLLVILVIGEIIPISQWMSAIVLTSMGLHRRVAFLIGAEGLFDLVALPMISARGSLFGVGVAVGLAAFVFRGLGPLYYGCRVLHISFASYIRQLKNIFLIMVTTILAFRFYTSSMPVESLLGLFLRGAVYVCLVGGLMLPILLDRSPISILRQVLKWSIRPRTSTQSQTRPPQERDIRLFP